MKKLFIIVFSMTIIMVFATGALSQFVQTDVNPARFYVVDDNSDPSPGGDDSVTLSGINWLAAGWSLEYSIDNISWNPADVASGITIATGPDDWELVYFRIIDGSDNIDNIADLKFLNPEGDLWNSVFIYWDGNDSYTNFTYLGADGDDNVAPVPIGSSALLLGSSIFGLMGFGIWRKHKILGSE